MSPNPVTRREQKQATREALREAARGCFAARGFADTAVGDIAAAAGVAHGTFYVHYPSKEAVLDELLAELNRELAARLAPALARGAAVDRAVPAAAATFLDFCRDQRPLVACYLERAAAGLDPSAFRDGINPPVAALLGAALTRAGRGASGPPAADLELFAHALLAMWLRVALRHLFGGASRAAALRVLVATTLGAVHGMLAGGQP